MSNINPFSNDLMHPVVPGETPPSQSSVRQHSNDLDRNAFLNLLITQLRYQDPLNPMDDREFIAQLAQFSALEQMQNLNTTFGRFQAFNMIGQNVQGITRNAVTGQAQGIVGRVESVRMVAGEPWLNVVDRNGDTLSLRANEVTLVEDDSLAMTLTMLSRLEHSNAMNQHLQLVGQYVQALVGFANGEPTAFVEGRVESIDFLSSPPFLVIGNERVILNDVISVSDRSLIIGQTIGYYSDTTFNSAGLISDVRISGENAYLVIDGGEFRVDRINFVSEALRLRGDANNAPIEVTHNGQRGHITQVFVRENAVWVRFVSNDPSADPVEPIQFARFIGVSTGNTESE